MVASFISRCLCSFGQWHFQTTVTLVAITTVHLSKGTVDSDRGHFLEFRLPITQPMSHTTILIAIGQPTAEAADLLLLCLISTNAKIRAEFRYMLLMPLTYRDSTNRTHLEWVLQTIGKPVIAPLPEHPRVKETTSVKLLRTASVPGQSTAPLGKSTTKSGRIKTIGSKSGTE